MPVLLVGRLMEGIGGGGLMALAFVAVGKLFPPRLTARALAVVSTLWGVSALLGPLTGGLFVAYADWRWGLWAFAAQAAALAVWIALVLRREPRPARVHPDEHHLVPAVARRHHEQREHRRAERIE